MSKLGAAQLVLDLTVSEQVGLIQEGEPLFKMIDLHDSYNSNFYEPYYCRCIIGYTPHYTLRGYNYISRYDPEPYTYLFKVHSITYKPRDHSSLPSSQGTAYDPPSYSSLSKFGTSCYGLQDYSYYSGGRRCKPRGYTYLSGPGTGYEPCGYGCRSSYGCNDEPCGFDPIPIGRSGYAYRRYYSCRPISGSPSYYGCRTYYPPSYWMEQNRYC